MKLTVVVDNNTLIGKTSWGEPGLSFYIEEADLRMLFDLGYSEACVRNMNKMGLDIKDVNWVVFSHGHLDHTWGLGNFMENLKASVFEKPEQRATLLAHPLALAPKNDDGEPTGFIFSEAVLRDCFDLQLSESPVWISDRLCFLGQIERTNDFENQKPLGRTIIGENEEEDYLLDDTALVYKAEQGLVIITGCSHSGICNIIEYAKKVCREERVLDIIGGFHLLHPSSEQLEATLEYLKELNPSEVYACHCTDLQSKVALTKVVKLKEVGVGLSLEYQ